MSATGMIALLWTGFGLTHLLLASVRIEPKLQARLGRPGYLALYSLVALAFFLPLVAVYLGQRSAGPWLWAIPLTPIGRWLCHVPLVFAIVLIVGGLTTPSPASVQGGSPEPTGVLRVTRHPMVMGLVLFGAMHVFLNGNAPSVAFFGGFAVFGLAGAWHQDRRKLHHRLPGFADFHARTSFLPFARAEAWRGLWEISGTTAIGGLAAAAALRWLHGPLLGV